MELYSKPDSVWKEWISSKAEILRDKMMYATGENPVMQFLPPMKAWS